MKSIFITGASSGIGEAIAREAAKQNRMVFVGYKQGRERAAVVVKSIRRKGGKAWPVKLDLTKTESISKAIALVGAHTQELEALVLCASPAVKLKSFLKTDATDVMDQWAVNVNGNHALISQVWKRFFSHRNAGHVVALLTAALGPPIRPHMTAYLISKSGLLTMLQCALAELGSSGLRVSAISPSYTDTPMLRHFHPHVINSIKAINPKKPFLSPEEVSYVAWTCIKNPPAKPTLKVQDLAV